MKTPSILIALTATVALLVGCATQKPAPRIVREQPTVGMPAQPAAVYPAPAAPPNGGQWVQQPLPA
ncbi:DUF1615 domain-containing protein, partial [bacterium]|nr:DUF1615 domain-containing protein [bacterium]